MDFFIKKIFEGKGDEFVHLQFQKFSKGVFEKRALVKIKNSKGKYSIATTSEYAREIIITLAEELGENKTQVTGALISALKLEGFDYKEKKSAIGINKYLIDKEMSGNELKELCLKIPKAFFGLNFKTSYSDLKIKPKSPKSTKSASSTKEDVKIDFCKIKTTNKEIVRNFLFDFEDDFKNAEIHHDFLINEIVIPEEMKKEKDFAKIRENSQRKGKIVRKIKIDDKENITEKEFIA